VRDIVAHQAGNAKELARVLAGHLAGEPVETRGSDREIPFRAMNGADLWDALLDQMALLGEVAEAGEALPADTDVGWTGCTMKVPQFAEHMREELVLHGWDITGDDPAAQARLGQAWMTDHDRIGRDRRRPDTRNRRSSQSPAAVGAPSRRSCTDLQQGRPTNLGAGAQFARQLLTR
jgi:hypothetical protein